MKFFLIVMISLLLCDNSLAEDKDIDKICFIYADNLSYGIEMYLNGRKLELSSARATQRFMLTKIPSRLEQHKDLFKTLLNVPAMEFYTKKMGTIMKIDYMEKQEDFINMYKKDCIENLKKIKMN